MKVTVAIEPGDQKATLRLTNTPTDGEPEVAEVRVAPTGKESVHVFDIQLNGKLEIEVIELATLVYDVEQRATIEMSDPSPMMAGAGEASAKTAKSESAKEESGASSPRRTSHK